MVEGRRVQADNTSFSGLRKRDLTYQPTYLSTLVKEVTLVFLAAVVTRVTVNKVVTVVTVGTVVTLLTVLTKKKFPKYLFHKKTFSFLFFLQFLHTREIQKYMTKGM